MPKSKTALEPRKPTGRPSTFTPTRGEQYCNLIASGENIHSLARKGWPKYDCIRKWLESFPPFAEAYARARVARADARADAIDELARKCAAGQIDPQAARVAIDSWRWLAGKENNTRYGDRVGLEVDATVRGEFTLADLIAVVHVKEPGAG